MTKNELVSEALNVAQNTYGRQINLKDMGAAYDSLCEVMTAEILGGGEISLVKLGKLKTRDVPSRKGRDPRTGEEITIPAHKKVVFVPGRDFRDALKAETVGVNHD